LLSRIESGTAGLSVEQLKRIAEGLKTSPVVILADVERAAEQLTKRGVAVLTDRGEDRSNLAFLGQAGLASLVEAAMGKNK
jgi:hypothetical protein